jgi:hypothetical protein
MFLTSLSGTVRIDPGSDLPVGEIERRLGHEVRRIGLIVLSDEPGLVAFSTQTVTDGKTWWWMPWGLFAMVSRGSFGLRGIEHDVVAYDLSSRRLLFRSIIPAGILFLVLITPSVTRHNPFLLLFPIGFWLLGYFGSRFVPWVRIRRWVRRVVTCPIEADLA